jgi:hypothetical protein
VGREVNMSILQMIGHSLLLRTSSFATIREREDVFQRGLLLLVSVSLVVGAVSSATGLVSDVRAPSPADALDQARAGFAQAMEQAKATTDIPPEVQRQIEEYFEDGMLMAGEIAELPVRLTQPAVHILKAVGRLLSSPFSWLGGWMLYTLLVSIAAHLMGGRASVQEMLGLTALHAAPYLFGIVPPLLGLIPVAGPTLALFVGGLLGVATWIWSGVIYVAATAVASRFDWSRGLLAVLAPMLVLTVIALIGGIVGLLVLLL